MDSVSYYDNQFGPDEDDPHFYCIERVYCFDWDRYSTADWNQLDSVYQQLPAWLGYAKDGYDKGGPYWFGVDEETPPFLWASVEPPGLQVYGILSLIDWEEWDKSFRKLTSKLPSRHVQVSAIFLISFYTASNLLILINLHEIIILANSLLIFVLQITEYWYN
ncbi:MAG: hypothetical protein AB1489_39700 [Acidobacteriota bacterium]